MIWEDKCLDDPKNLRSESQIDFLDCIDDELGVLYSWLEVTTFVEAVRIVSQHNESLQDCQVCHVLPIFRVFECILREIGVRSEITIENYDS